LKRYRSSLIFVGAIACLGALLFYDDWQTKRDELSETQRNRAIELTLDEVVSLELKNQDDDSYVKIVRQKDDWKIVEPIQVAADKAIVESQLRTFLDYKYERRFPLDLAMVQDYGFAAPSRELTIVSKTGEKVNLVVGKEVPVGYSIYFQNPKLKEVFIGSQYLKTAIAKKPDEFRDKKIVSLSSSEVAGFEYFVGGELVLSVRRSKDEFEAVSPVLGDLDQHEVADFLDEISRLKAEGFMDAASPEFVKNFESSIGNLEFRWTTNPSQQKQQIQVSSVGGEFWVRMSGVKTFFRISAETLKIIKRQLISFRDRRVIDFEEADINAVEIDGVHYGQHGQEFFQAEDHERKNARYHVQNLISDLAWAKASRFSTAKELASIGSLDAPRNVVKLMSKNNTDVVKFEFWTSKEDSSWVYLRINQAEKVFVLKASILDNLQQKLNEQPAASDNELPKFEADDGSNG
jgi:hypothetical protein